MSRNVLLTGAEQEEPTPRRLVAGPFAALLDAGQLRTIRWRGVEIIRAVSFLVRTPGWGTPTPAISNLRVEAETQRFAVSYEALYENAGQRLEARLSFVAVAEGRLEAEATLLPLTDFTTNRSGFVVLHPLEGFAGTTVRVEHASGESVDQEIPLAVSPGQPMFDIRAIAHRPAANLVVETRFDGDVFEMEDHRNWSDASFKTYSRPIGLPYPYQLAAGQETRQTVSIVIREEGPVAAKPIATDEAVGVAIGDRSGALLPQLLIGLDAKTAAAGLEYAKSFAALSPFAFLYRHDPSGGDGDEAVAALGALSRATGKPVAVELILLGDDDAEAEVARFAAQLAKESLWLESAAAFPASDRVSFQPGEARPKTPSEAAIAAALRRAFPGVAIVGGTPAFFTELNRKRPPAGLFDVIAHATTPTVHAADDRSAIETLESLPHIVRSAKQLAGDAGYRIGPIGVGARLNPYGPGPTPNPAQVRVGLADADPRQRGLLGAAWHLGYAARIAPYGVSALALGAPVGPFGLLSTPQSYPRAFWDELSVGAAFPLFHVTADLAEAGGRPHVSTTTADARVAALAFDGPGGRVLLLANLSSAPLALKFEGLGEARARRLDAASLTAAALDPQGFRKRGRRFVVGEALNLDAYAIARLDEVEPR
jgi:D-apionolactonase